MQEWDEGRGDKIARKVYELQKGHTFLSFSSAAVIYWLVGGRVELAIMRGRRGKKGREGLARHFYVFSSFFACQEGEWGGGGGGRGEKEQAICLFPA